MFTTKCNSAVSKFPRELREASPITGYIHIDIESYMGVIFKTWILKNEYFKIRSDFIFDNQDNSQQGSYG